MTSHDFTAIQDGPHAPARRTLGLTLPVYTLTIGLSAFLLFSVQPMFTKMVTPRLGGTPAVWSVAMVFFQSVLLLGYAYAHALTRWLEPRFGALLHIGLMGVVFAWVLPIALDPALGRPPNEGQALWLIGMFAASVGLPFFAVSANGPLLQAWFARTGHRHADDPYFLYGASNLGSFLALLAYPLVIEPTFALASQSKGWTYGFLLLGCSIALSALILAGSRAPAAALSDPPVARAPVGNRDRLIWIGLAFVPSALLVATTAHLSTDIAAVPLLWVVPLALFLLTFVVAFRSGGDGVHRLMLAGQPFILAILLLVKAAGSVSPFLVTVIVYLSFFFVSVTICHRELFLRRPEAGQLTQFYFMMSLGGVLGGAFASLLAPLVFTSILEFPLLVVGALMCRPDFVPALRRFGIARAAAAGAAAIVLFVMVDRNMIGLSGLPARAVLAVVLAFVAIVGLSRGRPLRLVFVAAVGFATIQAISTSGDLKQRSRSFFAVHAVYATPSGDGNYLAHGNTIHGAERLRDASGRMLTGRPQPASYFHPGGAYATAIGSIRAARGGALGRVAVVGLGMGSLACHARPGEAWDFYEIDPEVARIARDKALFRSLSACAPDAPVIFGDGRLTLGDAPPGYDLIVLDAFSSDSIPVHLITAEALRMYASRLAPGGAIIFNVSNRHMQLEHVVAGSAADAGLKTLARKDTDDPGDFAKTLNSRAAVAVVARDLPDLGAIAADDTWQRPEIPAGFRVWTDDFSNILDPLIRKLMR